MKNSDNRNQIRISHVNQFYGKKQALRDVSMVIPQGMFGLLGRNGAGKTTLMKTLAALHAKQSGEINICGVPVENVREIRGMIGYLPQEFSMYPAMTVRESLDYLGCLSGLSKKVRDERIEMLTYKVNLEEQMYTKVKKLSGGMKRRLGIAQALLHDPAVLIVDEPTAGLDPEERIRFRNLLCEVAQERIVILSTHIVGDVEAACGQIAIMNEGEVLWRGTVEELLDHARGKVFTADLESDRLAQVKAEFIVTGMVKQGNVTTVRILAETKPEIIAAEAVEPNCEDAYMYCLYQNGCENLKTDGNRGGML